MPILDIISNASQAAKVAYTQYTKAQGYVDNTGRALPTWDSLSESQKNVWISVVSELAFHIITLGDNIKENLESIASVPQSTFLAD